MRVSQAKTVADNGLRPVAITVLTTSMLLSFFLLTAAAFDASPLHAQGEVDRYGVTSTLR